MPDSRNDTLGPADDTALQALPPRDAGALVKSVRDRLRLAITLGELAPGSRLNQIQVAEQLGVSRMPVRAAAAQLVEEGILDPIPSGGFAIRRLTTADILEIYEVREALEAQAARHVALRRSGAGLDPLDDVLARHAALDGSHDHAALLKLDRAFHLALLEATENSHFGRAMVPLWSVVERAMVIMLDSIPGMFDRAWEQHRAIAEALHVGDADLAEARVRHHLQEARGLAAGVLSEETAPA